MKQFYKIILLLVFFHSVVVLASKPEFIPEKDCEKTLAGGPGVRPKLGITSSSLVKVSTLLDSGESPFIARVWRLDRPGMSESATAGLQLMYRTALTAADLLIKDLKISKAETPSIDLRRPLEAAAKTVELMQSSKPPPYIKNAVLIARGGYLSVVPLLKRIKIRDSKTRKAVYAPVIVKGHQDIRDSDLFRAAFAAWALQEWQGVLPDHADVYIKPMVEKRLLRKKGARENAHFKLVGENLENYIQKIEYAVQRFEREARVASEFSDREIQADRPEVRVNIVSPYASYLKAQLDKHDDITTIPYPPTLEQARALKKLGYVTRKRLSKLTPGSSEFYAVAAKAGIKRDRLLYFVARSKAIQSDRVIVRKKYPDPFLGAKEIVHIDFEDIYDRALRSGVYLAGVEIQKNVPKGVDQKLLKEFVTVPLKEGLSQASEDRLFANLFRFLNNHKRLKGKNYKITVYSHHELTKIKQVLDIVEDDPDNFSPQQRASPYYAELTTHGEIRGFFIRRKAFFHKFKDIKPEQIFAVISRIVDLLWYSRQALVFPTLSNGLKHTVPYASSANEHIEYPPGLNGLESMAWALEAYQTGDADLLEKCRAYNEVDIDANRLMADLVRRLADQNPDKIFRRSSYAANEEFLENFDLAYEKLSIASRLKDKADLLFRLLGRSLIDLDTEFPGSIVDLEKILDRSDYLRQRRIVNQDISLDRSQKESRLQKMRFIFSQNRKVAIRRFVEKYNSGALQVGDGHTNQAEYALIQLFEESDTYLLKSHLLQIMDYEDLNKKMNRFWERTKSKAAKDLKKKVQIPAYVDDEFDQIFWDEDGIPRESEGFYTDQASGRKIWYGLYFLRLFRY